MDLYAISDVHVRHPRNRQAIEALPVHPDAGLILGGDLAETLADVEWVFQTLRSRYAHLVWVPGNHELWTTTDAPELRGEAKYQALVELCRRYAVQCPEDPYRVWSGPEQQYLLAPLFVLYDYTFRPDDIAPENAVAWAREAGLRCADEGLLHPDPHASRAAWCHARCNETEERLQAAIDNTALPLILINHFPLRQELAWLPRIPRFSIWCGTRRTQDWHRRFRAEIVLFGHLHMRQRRIIDGVRFEEVSLGYPRHWNGEQPSARYLRPILPAPNAPPPRW